MKLALIGASQIASKILPSIKKCTDIEVAGFASTSKIRAAQFSLVNYIKYLGDYNSVFENANINAVYISTGNNDHEANIEKALNHGKHVLCEKPLVLSKASAIKLFKLAEEKKLILMEGLMYRFHPQILELKKRIQSGKYGKILKIRASMSFDYGGIDAIKRRLESGGGALPDLGCYLVDFVNSLTDSSPIVSNTTFKDTMSFTSYFSFKSGIVAEISSSMAHPSLNTWEVICEKASLSVNRFNPHEESETSLTIINDDSEISVEKIAKHGSGLTQFTSEFQNFADSIKGTSTPFITSSDSILNAETLETLISLRST